MAKVLATTKYDINIAGKSALIPKLGNKLINIETLTVEQADALCKAFPDNDYIVLRADVSKTTKTAAQNN